MKRWGPIFSVFGDELDEVLAGAVAFAPESQGMTDDVYNAARRYGALIEVICNTTTGANRPCTVYSCCEGVSVLVLPHRPASVQDADEALWTFENEKTSLDEAVFIAILAKGILTFFQRHVQAPQGLVTVAVGGGDFCFMRAEQRDAILQSLNIATSANSY